MSSEKRKYELRRRADGMEATRRRIAEAAMELHGSVGPARPSLSAVAERAGVQRHTLYRHVPTEADLFSACSGMFAAEHPRPDLAGWRAIGDLQERLAVGLGELDPWYEQPEPMLTNLYRDRALVAPVDANLRRTDEYLQEAAAALVGGPRRRRAPRPPAAAPPGRGRRGAGGGGGGRGGRARPPGRGRGAGRHAVDFQ